MKDTLKEKAEEHQGQQLSEWVGPEVKKWTSLDKKTKDKYEKRHNKEMEKYKKDLKFFEEHGYYLNAKLAEQCLINIKKHSNSKKFIKLEKKD